jgi:hypothetical protein
MGFRGLFLAAASAGRAPRESLSISGNHHVSGSLGDLTDQNALREFQSFLGALCWNYQRHADAHVENLDHLIVWNISRVLNDVENGWHFP